MRISRKVVPLQPKKNVEPFKERKGRPNEYKVSLSTSEHLLLQLLLVVEIVCVI